MLSFERGLKTSLGSENHPAARANNSLPEDRRSAPFIHPNVLSRVQLAFGAM
jgi:hypothetical protein